jgi:hypothetical protein
MHISACKLRLDDIEGDRGRPLCGAMDGPGDDDTVQYARTSSARISLSTVPAAAAARRYPYAREARIKPQATTPSECGSSVRYLTSRGPRVR